MLTTGTVLEGRYSIDGLLGHGGMGAVYRARHLRLNMTVAIKEMTPQPGLDTATLAHLRLQFHQEASVLAQLTHPHLVRVTDFFEESGSGYLVMEFVEGVSLASRITRQGALPEAEALAWAGQLLQALGYCHGRGVIHRDVKPHNVIIRPDGQAVLVDFGLVKLWDPQNPRTRTVMRGMGTPEYAPPEQYGARPGHTDPRSDIYSVGATLYHALTGHVPPAATDRMADPEQFVPPTGFNPRVSPATEELVLRAMALARSQRFQSAGEMAAALARCVATPGSRPAPQTQPTQAVSRPRPERSARRQRLPMWVWGLGGLALLTCVLGTLGMLGILLSGADGGTPVSPSATAEPPTAGSTLGDTWLRPADGMVMVYVPAGEFEMGSSEGDADEQPVHTVKLDGFWLDKTEVTNDQFVSFLNEQDNQKESDVMWLDLADADCQIERRQGQFQPASGRADHPVIEVSWRGAAEYCRWTGGELPTESEWEYAARGSEAPPYPWGTGPPDCDRANYWGNEDGCVGDATSVGSYPTGASWCGALDMAGNASEWVADWYASDYYSRSPTWNPIGPSSGEVRVLRGGSWNHASAGVRSANRGRNIPDDTHILVGFRCAR